MARGKKRDQQPAGEQQEADRQRPAAVENKAPAGGNVTDETIRDYATKLVAADKEFQTAKTEMDAKRGVYRSILRDAKNAGISSDALAHYIRTRRREPDDVDRETRERNRVLRIMGYPIGTQLGMFDETTTVATAVDEEQLAGRPSSVGVADLTPPAIEPLAPEQAGYNAGFAGRPWEECSWAEGTNERELWLKGWEDGVFKRDEGAEEATQH